ncbi:MAG: APC family permease [Actinomycetota bacterium]|nr:APC family permease [Actinomycetota bacterium]
MKSEVGSQVGLKKEMSRLDLTMAGLGAIIGSGWLFGVLYAANDAGPAAIVSWLIGGVAVALIGLVYAELSGMIPEAGGIARYPHFTHGSLTGFMMGWAAFIAYATVPAIEAEAVIQYSEHYIPGFSSSTLARFVAEAVLLVIFFLINYYGVKAFAKTNTVVTSIKFIMPTLTVLVFLFVAPHWSNLSYHATSASIPSGFAPYGITGVLKAVALSGVVFAYLGFRQAVDLAGEARNPQRDAPRAIITAIAIAIVLYAMLQVVFIIGVPATDLTKGWAALSFSGPFAQVASALGLGWLATLLYADAVLSPAGTGNVYLASTARVVYALANNKYLHPVFRKLNARSSVPFLGLVATLIVGILALLPFPTWQSLVGVISAATVFTYMIGPISASVLRKTHDDAHRPFRLGGMPVISPLAFVIGTLIIYWTGWSIDWKLVVAILGGSIIYAIVASRPNTSLVKVDGASMKSAAWLVLYLLFLLAMTYFGSAAFGSPYNHGKGLIEYPLDLVVVAVAGLIFYYAGVASGRRTEESEAAVANAAANRLASEGS